MILDFHQLKDMPHKKFPSQLIRSEIFFSQDLLREPEEISIGECKFFFLDVEKYQYLALYGMMDISMGSKI